MKKLVYTFVALLGITLTQVGFAKEPAIGQKSPDFTLEDTMGKKHSLSNFKGKYVVLEWINYGCPFVQKHYNSQNMQTLQKKYTGKNTVWLSVCSSAKGKEGYMSADQWNKMSKEKGSNACP